MLVPWQRISYARAWLDVLVDALDVTRFLESATDTQWLAHFQQRAANLPVVLQRAVFQQRATPVSIEREQTWGRVPFSPKVPTTDRAIYAQLVVWVTLGEQEGFRKWCKWRNYGWSISATEQEEAKAALAAVLAQLAPQTLNFVGTWGSLLTSHVGALETGLTAAAPLDHASLEHARGRLETFRCALLREALGRNPSQQTMQVITVELDRTLPPAPSPAQMLDDGESRIARLVRQLAHTGGLCATAAPALAPLESRNVALPGPRSPSSKTPGRSSHHACLPLTSSRLPQPPKTPHRQNIAAAVTPPR